MPLTATADPTRFYPPQGCTGLVTVQTRGCSVSNIWTCEADTPGDSWEIVFLNDGPVHMGRIDYEGQWLENYDMFPIEREVLEQPSRDPFSLTELFTSGLDTADFTLRSGEGRTRVKGFDRLTGETVVIDDEPLLITEFMVELYTLSGDQLYRREGNEHVSEKFRRFFGGPSTVEIDDRQIKVDYSPVEFIYPGEPGFFTKIPKYDCEAEMVRFVPIRKGSVK